MFAINMTSKRFENIVPRITQLDAVQFDDHIKELLNNKLSDVSQHLGPGTLTPVKPELQLLLDIYLFRNLLQKHGSTFGQQLLNLKYAEPLSQRLGYAYVFFNTVLPYLKLRYDESWGGRSTVIRSAVERVWNFGKLVQVINLLIFLREGIYPTVTERILGLKHVHVNRVNRGVGYNYMVRELLWHSFMDFLVFSVPIINFRALKRKVRGLIWKAGNDRQVPPPVLNLETICSVCQFRPNTPCRISLYCQHVACYVCLKGNILADEKFCCPDCGASNTAVEEFQYLAR